MNSKTALIKHLLSGQVINVKTCFMDIGLTNCSREIGRMVEKSFGVEVSRTQRQGKTRYGTPCTWVDYRLNHTPYNAKGIQEMAMYVLKQNGNPPKGKIIDKK